MSIIVAVGIAMNGWMFLQITENNPEFRSNYFEALGSFILPLGCAFIAYVSLASGNLELAVRMSLLGFLNALLITTDFYILISRKLKSETNKKSGKVEPDGKKQDNLEETEQEKLRREFQIRKL
jgi:hypothetical protein